jgi:hypothetical protein
MRVEWFGSCRTSVLIFGYAMSTIARIRLRVTSRVGDVEWRWSIPSFELSMNQTGTLTFAGGHSGATSFEIDLTGFNG